jgi:hypothetical protein
MEKRQSSKPIAKGVKVMSDTTTSTPGPGVGDKVKNAGNAIWDLIAGFFEWAWGYVSATTKKYLATAIVILMIAGVTLWTMRSVLEFKIPSWSSGQAEQPKIITKTVTLQPIGPTFDDLAALRARVKALESSKLATQPAPDKPKAKSRQKTKVKVNAEIPDPGSLNP